jgi:HAD superfamily hydrolase (TIGR01509 family)
MRSTDMTIQAFIFDVEGTLVDCVPQTLNAWEETLATHGLTVARQDLQAHSGMNGSDMLKRLVPGIDDTQIKELTKAQGDRYHNEYLSGVRPFPAIRPLFERLKAMGASLALATDCDSKELERYRALLGIDRLLDAIACGDQVKEGKPHPTLIELALRQLNIRQPDQVVMIGDTPYDAEAARAAGVVAWGVLTGGHEMARLKQSGCARLFPTAADIADQLDTFNCAGEQPTSRRGRANRHRATS